MAVDQTGAGEYDPPMPGEEGGVASSASVATLGQALGFINEFNHNVAIFEPLATVFVMAVGQLIGTSGIVIQHHRDISILKDQRNRLWDAIYLLLDKANTLEQRLNSMPTPQYSGGAYNPAFDADGRNDLDCPPGESC